jgi:hypothetical protein
LWERVLPEENRAGILLSAMPECGVEKASKKRPQGYRVANGSFSSTKSAACKPPSTPDLGKFVNGQIEAQGDQPNPVSFDLPEGTRCRVWLASNSKANRITDVERHWRTNVEALLKVERERRPTPITPWRPTAKALGRPIVVVGCNEPVKNIDDALGVLKGLRVRICIEGEKELQALGLWLEDRHESVQRQFVLLHHNGNTAMMKRKAFKELVAAMRAIRPKRPRLRLVVSNSSPFIARAEAA